MYLPILTRTARLPILAVFGIFSILFSQCAPTRRGPLANQYHNITSHYNCWWIAKEHLKQVDEDILLSHQHNYNRILQVFPTIDSTVIKADSLQLADAIKKASIGITRHPYSNWTDNNYILVGKTRLYMAEFENAVETFKYVNTTSEEDDERHTALIYLMRTFVEKQDYGNAVAVSDFLTKEELNRSNKKLLYLTRAHLHQVRENLDGVVENLVVVAPLLRRSEEKAKIYFIIGQIYQELGLDVKAYEYYQKCTKTNPEYELFFYARLNMNQVAVLDGSSDVKRVRKYYRKLLRDDKNIDFQDKIYYEMGRFEQKQGNLELAIDNYKSSALSSTNNPRQKSYAYWELGKIYFTDLKDYELAKAYYDSTVMVMPEDEEEFAAIQQRQQVLAEFVEHVTTIAQTDSVLTLANMDSVSRAAVFAKVIDAEEVAAAEEQKRQRRAARQQQFVSLDEAGTGTFSGGPQAGSIWYYYNPTAITAGQADFRRKWGDRPLERNWRRSAKGLEEGGLGEENEAIAEEQEPQEVEATPVAELSPEERRAKRQQELLNTLPLTAEAQQEAYSKLEFAYYRLGDIYREDLEEPVNAIPPFESLLNRFDTSQYAPEVMYQLYLIYQNYVLVN
ncbi:MAG: methyltransferase, partial [Bacteroidota bacterium]